MLLRKGNSKWLNKFNNSFLNLFCQYDNLVAFSKNKPGVWLDLSAGWSPYLRVKQIVRLSDQWTGVKIKFASVNLEDTLAK